MGCFAGSVASEGGRCPQTETHYMAAAASLKFFFLQYVMARDSPLPATVTTELLVLVG